MFLTFLLIVKNIEIKDIIHVNSTYTRISKTFRIFRNKEQFASRSQQKSMISLFSGQKNLRFFENCSLYFAQLRMTCIRTYDIVKLQKLAEDPTNPPVLLLFLPPGPLCAPQRSSSGSLHILICDVGRIIFIDDTILFKGS